MTNNSIDLLKLKFENKEISSFYDCLSDILLKISGGNLYKYPEFKKYFSNFMLCRYLSMHPSLISFAEYLNKIQLKLSQEQFYKLTYFIIPKQKTGYIRYIKKVSKDKNEIESLDESFTKINIFDL